MKKIILIMLAMISISAIAQETFRYEDYAYGGKYYKSIDEQFEEFYKEIESLNNNGYSSDELQIIVNELNTHCTSKYPINYNCNSENSYKTISVQKYNNSGFMIIDHYEVNQYGNNIEIKKQYNPMDF